MSKGESTGFDYQDGEDKGKNRFGIWDWGEMKSRWVGACMVGNK